MNGFLQGEKDIHENQMPDTPWHIGYAKKKEDDPSRHRARCIHYVDGKCICYKSVYRDRRCGGSSHCSEYSESEVSYKKHLEETKTAEEIEREHQRAYDKRKNNPYKLTKAEYCKHKINEIDKCYVCQQPLFSVQPYVKKCSFCGMHYAEIQVAADSKIAKLARKNAVIFVGKIKSVIRYTNTCSGISRGIMKYYLRLLSLQSTANFTTNNEMRRKILKNT